MNLTRAQALAGTAMVVGSGRRAFAQSTLTPVRVAQIWCNAHPSDAQDMTAAFTGIAVDANPRDVQPKTFDAAELYMR